MGVKVYVDVDEQGNILLPCIAGTQAVADKEYDYFFDLDELDLELFPSGYKVENGELVKK